MTRGHLPEAAVAIVGMSGRFPGAPDLERLWRLLADGEEGITRFTEEELREAGVPAGLIAGPGYVPAAGILAEPAHFDAAFFGFTPSDAETTDPQQRLFLETCWWALEDAGYPPGAAGGRVGVFAGAATTGYRFDRIDRHPRAADLFHPVQLAVGNDLDMLALRAAYKLDLTGPAITVQTTCSSSLVAVHLAGQSLLARECDLALAGGSAVRFPEPQGYRREEGDIVSADGHCRPFDAASDGTVPGDGVGVIVLKRLADAVADRDHVYAVILGSAVNNDGAAKAGITAPSPGGQAAVISEALAVADVDPATIQYVEAHGTATRLGDPIEIRALAEALGPGAPPGSCRIGSIKSNIGHADTAAGIAGVIKTDPRTFLSS
ncbi:polyketide synthase, partial [Nonomuraea sp. NPDC055795]